jgi:hypothetical protein
MRLQESCDRPRKPTVDISAFKMMKSLRKNIGTKLEKKFHYSYLFTKYGNMTLSSFKFFNN